MARPQRDVNEFEAARRRREQRLRILVRTKFRAEKERIAQQKFERWCVYRIID